MYGLYWKQNRKNCIAFLSLDSKLSLEAHMKWMECQIQNLEAFRRGNFPYLFLLHLCLNQIFVFLEILQSNGRPHDKCLDSDKDRVYQNLNNTIKVCEGLEGRPLPQVPHEIKSKYSDRLSTVSGIYDEILEGPIDRLVALSQKENYKKVINTILILAQTFPLCQQFMKRSIELKVLQCYLLGSEKTQTASTNDSTHHLKVQWLRRRRAGSRMFSENQRDLLAKYV